ARYRIITYPDQQKLYSGLQHNDVQVILSQSVNYSFYLPLDRDQQNFVMFDASPSPPIPYHLVFNRDRFTPVMIDGWMRVIEQIRFDGPLEQFYRRHVPLEMSHFLLPYGGCQLGGSIDMVDIAQHPASNPLPTGAPAAPPIADKGRKLLRLPLQLVA